MNMPLDFDNFAQRFDFDIYFKLCTEEYFFKQYTVFTIEQIYSTYRV